MPFQFPGIQKTINQTQSLAAGLAAQELPEMARACAPAWGGAAIATHW